MKFTNNLTHAQAVDTRPFSRLGRGLGTRLKHVMYTCYMFCILVDKELAEERKKLYEAIGYSENAKLATYSEEVCVMN